ncbi:MAG: CDP-alcohol phosphatidyltransferase family protein, partial [Actinomycetota bacterium]|nr:CDP-alcohol phosphatidyltransferase family protein [Actinomycetota bacterium]
MLDQKIRAGWDRLMQPVGRSMARLGISANALTFVGFAVQVVAAYLVLEGRLFVAGVVVVAAALFDVLDGAVAKATSPTKYGALFDSTMDRLSDA